MSWFLGSLASSSVLSSSSVSSSTSSSSVSANREGANLCKRDSSQTDFIQFIMESKHAAVVDFSNGVDVYIDHNKLHWFLLLKMKGTPDKVGFFTLEIATPNLSTIQKQMFEYITLPEGCVEHCGTIEGHTLRSILEVADLLVTAMGSYSLFSSNCQHFCNNFLNHFRLKVYSTTLGKDVTMTIQNSKAIDKSEEDAMLLFMKELNAHQSANIGKDPFRYNPDSQLSRTEVVMRQALARILNTYVGAV